MPGVLRFILAGSSSFQPAFSRGNAPKISRSSCSSTRSVVSENSIGLKTQVLEGPLEKTLGQRYYALFYPRNVCVTPVQARTTTREISSSSAFWTLRATISLVAHPKHTYGTWQRKFHAASSSRKLTCRRAAPAKFSSGFFVSVFWAGQERAVS